MQQIHQGFVRQVRVSVAYDRRFDWHKVAVSLESEAGLGLVLYDIVNIPGQK